MNEIDKIKEVEQLEEEMKIIVELEAKAIEDENAKLESVKSKIKKTNNPFLKRMMKKLEEALSKVEAEKESQK